MSGPTETISAALPYTSAEVDESQRKAPGVGDIARLKKGHTEGLEPSVTEHLVKLIVS